MASLVARSGGRLIGISSIDVVDLPPADMRDHAERAVRQLGLMGLTFTVITALAYSALAWSAGSVGARLGKQPRIALWLERATGIVFIAMAARLALAERK